MAGKKSNAKEGSQKKEKAPMKLHADAKEFVPSAATLKATAAAFHPKPSEGKSGNAPNGDKAGKNGASNASEGAGTSGAPGAFSDANANATKPKVAAAPKGAWGSKPSDAIKKAAPIQPAQPAQQAQRQQAQQKQSPQGHRGGGGGGDKHNNDNHGWKRNEKGRKHDNQNSSSGGTNAGSWARAAAKPGGGNKAAPPRQQNRGNQSGGSHGDRHGHGDRDRHGHSDHGNGEDQSWSRGKVVPIELLKPGEGKTNEQKAVKRVSVEDLLGMRLSYLSAPASWEGESSERPPTAVFWDSPTRVSEIEASSKAPRMMGDVTPANKGNRRGGGGGGKGGKGASNETAPPLEDCKPIEVNEETRWKAKVFEGKKEENPEEQDSKEEILRKALLILNKLSLTKFDKLSDEFISCGIGRDVDCLTGAVSLIVNKAQEEQHFSSMYAGLCLKLANTPMEGIDDGTKKGKKFKKILLERCQTEFETDTSTKIKEATKDSTDEDEKEYHANLIKKHYLGHMRFIGELYKGDLISIKIMLFCLPELLKGGESSASEKENKENNEDSSIDIDEEKVECFAKLMTVIGSSLEQQSEAMRNVGKGDAAESLADCWRTVEIMAGKRKEEGPRVSNRIKFMLQDLLEMKEKGWVTRRKEETAKTIAQIHNEVAKEERAARRSSSSNALRGMSKASLRRGASSGDVRVLDKALTKPQVDEDGFVSVVPSKGFNRSASMTALGHNQPDGGWQKQYSTRGSTVVNKPENGRRSSLGKFAPLKASGLKKTSFNKKEGEEVSDAAQTAEESPKEAKPSGADYPTPDECGEKIKNILKEYFVGGDTDDAILSVHELVGAGREGSVERGSKVVESAILLVLEMKQEDVDKFLLIFLQCAKEKKIEGESFISGLNDPLEFLNDVAIDAPLAIQHLAGIVADLVKADIIPFDFLLNSPDYFRTDQNAASFGGKVMKKIGGDAVKSEDYIEVVEKLMTDEDKAKYSSASDLIEAA